MRRRNCELQLQFPGFLLDNPTIVPLVLDLVYDVHHLELYCSTLEEPNCNHNTMRNLLLLFIALFGFGAAQAQDCTGADHTVLAGNYYYNPSTLTVTAGESIAFLNEAGFHNVNGVDDTQTGLSFGNPETFSLGANSGSAGGVCMGTVTLNTPGTYSYDCSIGSHAAQGMVGTIIVEAASSTSNITFTVDVPANITVAAGGMHIAGTMNGWGGEPMSDNGDGSWSKTFALEDGDVTFKFQNGLNGWESTADRVYTVAGADAEYSACWETTLAECPGSVPVTFQVDMANAGLVGGESIFLAGSLNGWCGGCTVMSDADADGIYTATVDLSMNSDFEFKYLINGYANDGGTEENMIGTACDWNPNDAFGNRGFSTTEAPLTLDVVCFNYCGTCEEQNNDGGGGPTGPTDNAADPTQDASNVISIYSDAYADIATNYNPNWGQSGNCCVNATFDPGSGNNVLHYANFNYQGTELQTTDASSMEYLHVDIWVEAGTDRLVKVSPVNNGTGAAEFLVNVPLTPGAWNSVDLPKADFDGMTWDSVFQLKFDGQFNGDGSANTTPYDIYLDNVYFWGTGGGGGGPVDVPTVSVTLNVNMANQATSPQGVFLAGGADFGAPGANPMSDVDGDDIWTITLDLDSGYTGYYTFANGACADYSCKENLSGLPCGDPANFNDRQLVNIVSDTTISTCFAECSTDGSCSAPPTEPLLAALDVSCSGVADVTSVRMTGPFWGWDPAGGPEAILNGTSGLWEVTFDPAPSATMEYLWVVNSVQENLIQDMVDGADCAPVTDYANYANRVWMVTDGNIADTYDTCGTCNTTAPDSVLVTITVDMSEEDVNPIGVFVAGSFQGWSPGSTLATDNGDGTWSYSFNAAPGTNVQYKWLNGTAWGFEETVPSDCQYPGDSNRGFDVPTSDYSHPVHCFGSCNPCGAATYATTLTVLTDNITVAGDGMYAAGAFEGWSGTAMSDNGDGSWSITLDLEAGSYEFKFQNGAGGWEELDCGGNRTLTVDGSGPVSYTGCFAQCGEATECAVDPDPANITFQVDMSQVTGLIADSVYMIGSFTDPVWQAGAIQMDDADGDLVYTATVLVSGPAGIAYKFFNGNPYPNGAGTEVGGETADFAAGGCGVENGVGGFNRTYDRSGSDETLDVVCFNSCSACGGGDLVATLDVSCSGLTDITSVRIFGPFWGWDPNGGPEATLNSEGLYEVVFSPAPDADMEYKWLINGEQEDLLDFGPDLNNDGYDDFLNADCVPITDYFSYANRLWTMGSGDIMDTWSTCEPCAGTPSDSALVTFSVDMNSYVESFGFVNVSGDWNGFCGDCNQLTDDDSDGIWTGTFLIPPGENQSYKYQVDAWADQEDLAPGGNQVGPCVRTAGGFTNRDLDVMSNAAIDLGVVCWASCLACGDGGTPGCTDDAASNYDAAATYNDGSCLYNVTFNVNMSQYALADLDSVYVNGTFNGWCGPCNPLLDTDGDGIYSATIELAYDYYEYKYTVNGWTAEENLAGIGSCVTENYGFTNRVLQLAGNQSEPVVCWNSCSDCVGDDILGCTDSAASNYSDAATADDGTCQYPVTFKVDMDGYGGTWGTVNLNGSFANWCGDCITMTDDDADNVYEVTVNLGIGTVEYKFTVDGWTDQEFFDPSDVCTSTIDGFTNRTLDVAGSATLDVVCWESCYTCDAPVGCTDANAQNYDDTALIDDGSCAYMVTLQLDMNTQTVGAGGVHVAGAFQGWDPGATAMSTPGLGLYTYTVQLTNGSYQFIYINGNTWDGQETVPAECGADNGLGGFNRLVTVDGSDLVLDVVCFNSCEACAGCTDPLSAEFSPWAGSDDGSCATPLVFGCTYADADNYNPGASVEDGSCQFSGASDCPTDIDGDGATAVGDLLIILGAFGQTCE